MNIRPRKSLLNPVLQRPSALNSKPRDSKHLWLDKNENLDAELEAVLRSVLLELPSRALNTYPEAGETYRKLAKWLGVAPEQLLLTPGSDGAIRLVFEAFVEQGDVVVHTSPTFAMYPVYSQMFGAEVHALEYAKTDKGPSLEPQIILDSLRKHKPKLLCLPNPDSPTGTALASDVLREILNVCESTGTLLLLDEAYHPFYEWTGVPWTETSRNLVVARTFAKAWGAAGLRIGYAVAHPETIALLHKMRPMYEVNTLAVEFMSMMLDKSDEMMKSVTRINEGKRYFQKKMETLGFDVLSTEGNFLHVAFGEQGASIHAALAPKVYYRAAFDCPSLAGYSRFSMAPKPIMEQVVDIIKQAVLGKTV
jgi:histidinol-phosphate aminotransferase